MESFIRYRRVILPQIAFSLLSISVSNSQTVQSDNEKLNLADMGCKIENTIILNISVSDYENVKAVSGKKVFVKARLLLVNGDTLQPEEISTRGQTTLYYRRKSYSFDLQSDATFNHGEKDEKIQEILCTGTFHGPELLQ